MPNIGQGFQNLIAEYVEIDESLIQSEHSKNVLYAMAICKILKIDPLPCFVDGFTYLSVGSVGAAYNLEELKSSKISHILCLASKVKLKFPDKFCYCRVNMLDSPDTNLSKHLLECFKHIEEARNVGGKILIHCFQGKSRSVAVCCAYLISFHGFSLNDALQLIRSTRPTAMPNAGFMAYLKSMESLLCQPSGYI